MDERKPKNIFTLDNFLHEGWTEELQVFSKRVLLNLMAKSQTKRAEVEKHTTKVLY